jgi:hypothetical protein
VLPYFSRCPHGDQQMSPISVRAYHDMDVLWLLLCLLVDVLVALLAASLDDRLGVVTVDFV